MPVTTSADPLAARSGGVHGEDLELEPAARRVHLGDLAATEPEDRSPKRRGDRDPAGPGVRLVRADERQLEPCTGLELAPTYALADVDAPVPQLGLDDLRGP
jgi:hypothetical protein